MWRVKRVQASKLFREIIEISIRIMKCSIILFLILIIIIYLFCSGAVRVGVAIYSTGVQVEFHLNEFSSKADVYQAIDNIPYIYGSTNTADALQKMNSEMFTRRNGDRPHIPNTCIIVTDGVSSVNTHRTIPEAQVMLHVFARYTNMFTRMLHRLMYWFYIAFIYGIA